MANSHGLQWIVPRAAAGVLLSLAACAPRAALSPTDTARAPQTVHITNVPFFANTTDQCGPAALASVLNYWGKATTPMELKPQVYLPRQKGTLPMDMRPALTKNGLSGQVISGSFEDIKSELQRRRPVIAYLDFGTRKHPIGHFVVITGYDDKRKGLYLHSGAQRDKFASYKRFNRGWKDADHWLLIAAPPGEFPAGSMALDRPAPQLNTRLTAEDYTQLGNIYEGKNLKTEAQAQYQLALEQNKHFEPALMALGNMAFQAGNYKEAEKYYRKVLRKNPAHGGANNNLAMVYLSTGKSLKEAETYALKATKTEYRPYAEDTLQQIKEKRATKAGKETAS